MSNHTLLPCEIRWESDCINKVKKRMPAKWFFVPFILLLASQTYSQTMVPEFTANQTSGCAPLGVSFRDLTTGNPKFWNWDFGNGTLANVQNPSVTYSLPGTYTVKLVVRNADGTNGITKTNYITVFPSPSANFSANITTGCVPVNIQFTDKSTSTAGSIVSWLWDFGDGTTSTAQNPQKTYSTVGFYSVTLTITSSTGCKSVASAGRYIRIVPGVKPEFDNSAPATCRAPYIINFTNLSTGPGNMTYQWDLGNGTSSNQTDPTTTYNSTGGTYNVTLTATSDFGCSGTITKPLNINGPVTSIKAPDTVCQNNTVWFTNNSVTPQKTVWDFGNGQQSIATSDSTKYPNPGSYVVKLYNTYSGCMDSATHNIYVRQSPNIDFTATNVSGCKPPLVVNFSDASSAPIVNWQWNFGDGGTGSGSPVSHTYSSAGTFDVTITFTDNAGCPGTITKPAVVKIVNPTVSITNVPTGGCIPYTFTPGVKDSTIDGVASYAWDFGDGTTGTGANPSHVYTNTGNYTVKLTITTNGGCTATDIVNDAVKTGTPPATKFSMSATDVCAQSAVHFTDLTPMPVDEWKWDFGDGGSSGSQNPDHEYKDTGTFTVKLTAYNNRCSFTSTGQVVHIKPPVPKFVFAVTCGSLTVPFTDQSKTDPSYGPISYSWEFGNPVVGTSNQQNPVFAFPALGVYQVKLTVTNGSCTAFFLDTVYLIKEIANFTVPTPVCRKTDFTVTSTNNPLYISTYEWATDGGPYTTGGSSFTTNFGTNGSHPVSLRITDINGCTDVKNGSVTVTGPVANFKPASPGGCINAIVAFNDLSTPAGTITSWKFNFGDNQVKTFTSPPFTHNYKDTGEFVVRLTVTDNVGCTDTYKTTDTVFISTPKPWFNSDYTIICPASSVQFTDSSTGKGLTYSWNFGNGGTSNQQNPVYSYGGSDTTYSVKLVITDRAGCSDSVTRINYITTKKPKPAFDIQDTLTICPPIETKFFFKGADYESFEWDFGDGASSTLLNPTHFYNSYGDFTAKLYLTGYGGCIDSTSHNVHVYNPGAVTKLTASPTDACNEITVDFTVTTPPDMKWIFAFGDGTNDTTMATTYQHYYGAPAFYYPSVQYTDNQGCVAGVGGPVIKVIGADPFFALDRKKFCDSGIVYFTNYTIGNDPVVTRTWDFNDGSPTTSDVDPIHYFQQPGTYLVSQTVTTQTGCTKTVTDSVKVYRTPDPYITGDSIGCLNEALNLQGVLAVPDTAITWKWTFGNNTFLSTQNVSLNFPTAGNYTVYLQATNALGCTDTTSTILFVPPIPSITIATNPVIPVSTGVTLPVTYGPDIISYTWKPIKNLSCIDCPNPYANPKFTTTYNIQVQDKYGCTNNKDITVTVVCNGLNYFIPNTFSPNGDGVNDVFAPRGIGLTRVNSMRIFNRWGELVYEKMNFMANDRTPTGGWDGTYKGKPASPDVYVYIIEFVCENAAIVPVKGNVALVR